MDKKEKEKLVNGMFSGCTFQDSVVVGIAEKDSVVCYNHEKGKATEENMKKGKAAIMEYVGRIKPLATSEVIEVFDKVWLRILELDVVKCVVYERGRQQQTTFNRNFVANIIHVMENDGLLLPQTNPSIISEYLEPQKGKNHPVRGSLILPPEPKVKRAIEDVFREFGLLEK